LLLGVIKHKIMAGTNTKHSFNDVEKRMVILNRKIYVFQDIFDGGWG